MKEKLKSNTDGPDSLVIRNARVKQKKIIVLSIPNSVTEEDFTSGILQELEIKPQDREVANIKLLRRRNAKGENYHQPVLLPEQLADILLKRKWAITGARECRINAFIHIMRCNRCLRFDHTAAECQGSQRCMKCAGKHQHTECTASHPHCYACTKYNELNGTFVQAHKDTSHEATSGSCWVYRTLLRVRQLQLGTGSRVNSGNEVINGQVDYKTVKGKDVIVRLPYHDHLQRCKHYADRQFMSSSTVI